MKIYAAPRKYKQQYAISLHCPAGSRVNQCELIRFALFSLLSGDLVVRLGLARSVTELQFFFRYTYCARVVRISSNKTSTRQFVVNVSCRFMMAAAWCVFLNLCLWYMADYHQIVFLSFSLFLTISLYNASYWNLIVSSGTRDNKISEGSLNRGSCWIRILNVSAVASWPWPFRDWRTRYCNVKGNLGSNVLWRRLFLNITSLCECICTRITFWNLLNNLW